MKNQLRSPLEILVEILITIFISALKVLFLLGGLLYELYLSLRIMSYTNPFAFILALSIGALILFFTSKYLLGSTIAAIKIMTIYIVIVVLLLTIFGGEITITTTSTTTIT